MLLFWLRRNLSGAITCSPIYNCNEMNTQAHRRSDLKPLLLIASAGILLHLLTNGRYGWHRDELATLDDAGHLAWGYVAYPPLTPFIARIAMELFGLSLIGVRFFASLAQGVVIVVAGLMARELGGARHSQVLSAVAVAICPVALASGALFQYVSFDFLWWVLAAFFVMKLLNSENPKWWIAIGGVIGFGMMTKYTMLFLVAGIAAGILFTSARRWLRSPWLWAAAGLSLAVFIPNLVWQWQHDFISLDFLRSIHARDVRIGRTDGFLAQQFFVGANPFTVPLWLAGLYHCLFSASGRRYRLLGWLFVVPLLLFIAARGRSYYLAPAYPVIIAAGAVAWGKWMARISLRKAAVVSSGTWGAMVLGGILGGVLVLPLAPVNSWLWGVVTKVQGDFAEEIGWPELVDTVARIYSGLSEQEKRRTGILAGNYGEAGAINLLGPAYGLPKAISGVNSYWFQGYGEPPPETLIVLGFTRERLEELFSSCELAGHLTNRFGVVNEESSHHPDIFICRGLRTPWPQLWKTFRRFG
jgi:hypothetical protein